MLKMTIEEHRELGRKLVEMDRELAAMTSLVPKQRERIGSARREILRIRSDMECTMVRDHGQRLDTCHTYFGDAGARAQFQARADGVAKNTQPV